MKWRPIKCSIAGLTPAALVTSEVSLPSWRCVALKGRTQQLLRSEEHENWTSSQGTAARQAVDIGLGIAIPLHSHIALNTVVSDYVPKSVRGSEPDSFLL